MLVDVFHIVSVVAAYVQSLTIPQTKCLVQSGGSVCEESTNFFINALHASLFCMFYSAAFHLPNTDYIRDFSVVIV